MTDGDKKRKMIFDKFSNNLTLLAENNILKDIKLKFEKTYICPICTEQFSENALNQNLKNPLTLEDAPPKSLGGKANILTCKSCNNTCGQKIDFHLTERMRELDHLNFLPNTEFNAKFEQNGRIIQGTIKIGSDGTIQALHKNKTNNPINLSTYIKSISKERKIKLNFLEPKSDPFKVQLALLKIGFLMTFSQYGYAFILSPL
jgi:transcription elongation factor Elf1